MKAKKLIINAEEQLLCNCHHVMNIHFDEDLHYDADTHQVTGDPNLMKSSTVMNTPADGTIIIGRRDNFLGEQGAEVKDKITFNGVTAVEIVYPHGIDSRPAGIDTQAYPGGDFTGIISEGRFFVWNVELHAGA